MDRRMIVLIGLMVLVGGVFVYAQEPSFSISISKGWNLIPTIAPESVVAGSPVQWSEFKYAYVYIPHKKDYVMIVGPEGMIDPFDSSTTINQREAEQVLRSSMWVYSEDVEGSLVIRIDEDVVEGYFYPPQFELDSGWNFLWVTPYMIGKSLNDLSGNCNIQKAYVWEAEHKQWTNIIDDPEFYSGAEGTGLVLKVSSDCTLGSSVSSILPPPGLPSDNGGSIPPESGEISINYPQEISGYSLKNANLNDDNGCGNLNGDEICLKMGRLEYYNEGNQKAIHVAPTLITKGNRTNYESYLKENSKEQVSLGIYRLVEEWELAWFAEDYIFITQEYTYTETEDGGTSASSDRASVDNPVVQYFLNQYPSIE